MSVKYLVLALLILSVYTIKKTGKAITPTDEAAIQAAIDTAYAYFGENALSNAKYISDKLSIRFQARWNVIIVMNSSVASLDANVGYVTYGEIIGKWAYWTSVNEYQKDWTYLLNQYLAYPTGWK